LLARIDLVGGVVHALGDGHRSGEFIDFLKLLGATPPSS
jgi:hypothetical protein